MRNRSFAGLLAAVAVAFSMATPAARAVGVGPLSVLRITPSGANVPSSSQEIVIKFDRDMVALGNMARKPDEIPIDSSPALDCEWRWLTNDELACRLPGEQHLRPATHYTLHLGTGLAALDGSRLAAPVTAGFTTELPDVHWARFERWLSPVTPQYQIMFNLPVTAEAVAHSVAFVRNDTGKSVPARAMPFTAERRGPLLLPVPGVPGSVVLVDHPQPVKPADADKPAYAARKVWLVKPARELAPGANYTLKLGPGLVTPLGTLPGNRGKIPGQDDITTFGPFTLNGIDCRAADGSIIRYRVSAPAPAARCVPDSVRLAFSAPVPRATLAAVRWSPTPVSAAKLAQLWGDYPQWSLRAPDDPAAGKRGSDYGLPFQFSPMRHYRVSVPADVTDQFGRKLAAPAALGFMTGHLLPTLNPETTGGVLESNEDTAIAMRFSNLTRLDLNYHRLTASMLEGTRNESTTAHTLSLLGQFGGKPPRDRLITVPLGARGLLGGHTGLIAGKLHWAPRTKGRDDRGLDVFAEVTPWEVLAKISHFGTLVWVNSLATGEPVAGARLRFYTTPKKAPWDASTASNEATTNSHGLAVLPGTITLGADWTHRWSNDTPSWFMGATKGDDMGYLPLVWDYRRDVGDASGHAFYSNAQPPHGHLRAWAVTAQGVYRPGATVHYTAFVRGIGNITLKPAPDLHYTLTITDPTGKKALTRKDVKLSPFGGLHGDLYVPKSAATGWYQISLSWPSGNGTQSRDAGRFLVTAFVPASFKVSTLLHGSLFAPGDGVTAQAQARLHAGGPYTDSPIRFTVKLNAEPFAPDTPVAAGFNFDSNADSAPDSLTLYQSTGQLDNAGNAGMEFALPGESPIVYGKLVVQSAVKSARGTWVANRASAVWSARDRFVGLKIDEWLLHAGKSFKLHYLVVDAGGAPQGGSEVHISLERRKINVVQVADGAGNYQPEQKTTWVREGHCDAVSTAAPGVCSLTPGHSGTYRVVAGVTDTHGQTQQTTLRTWSVGSGQVLWPTGKGVTLVPDKASYHVGDTAHVLVQNPYPGARALVTVERYGIVWKKVMTLAGGTPVLDIPIEKSFFPGAYLSVAIFSPRVAKPDAADLGKPTMALGYVALPVEGKGSSLTVNVKPERDEYKPRQQVNVDVEVKDAGGKPAAHTRLVVAVVDEAVLDLVQGGASYYDPRKAFYAPPDGPDVLNYSLIGQLVTTLKQTRVGKGQSPGGGGGGQSIAVRSVFKYTAFWKPDLQTDASGHAQFSFELPDNLTGWRVVVMALKPGAEMGLGQSTIRVNLPLQVGPALPNIVHAGDEFDAGFSVTNRTGDKQHISVGISAQGAASGTASSVLDLAPYAHALAWLPLKASAPGKITLLATARAGKLGDAMRKPVPVETAGTRVVAAAYGNTTGTGASIPIKLPDDALAGSGELTVGLAPTALANLTGAFAHMRDDPLKTWEVRLSRGVMASNYLMLKDALPGSLQWPNAAHQITDMLQHAGDFQAPNGGMAFWIPKNEFVSQYLSVYTALAFDWLHAAGHTPPVGVRSALDDYLLKNIIKTNGKDAPRTGPILKAAALAALADHDKLPKGAVAGMLPKLPRLDLFGKAMLLEAALETHDAASTGKIAAAILAHAEETAGSISFQETEADAYASMLASPLRSNCVVLDALTQAAQAGGDLASRIGDVPAKLLRWIDARRGIDGAWPNSQENVFCTTAQAHYAQAFEHPVADLVGSVASASRDIGNARFASRRSAPQSIRGKALPGAATVDIKRSGKGRLYYGVNLAYTLPAASVPAANAGFSVHRDYRIERDGKWVKLDPATKLKRGDIVRVDLLVDVPAERHHVVLTDPLPGAFEAVNHKLATADATTPERTPNSTILWFDYGDWPNYSIVSSGFYHRDTGFDAVRFYADVLPAGRYHLIYATQVIAPGRFLAPPPEAHEIYQPDVFGRGTPATITVAMPTATKTGK